ncbi:MAG: Ig-like domain-containing protein [Opitutaceae bacterium]|nr:Ig-like domain-containing protein [Opitutaceae bacterium]
MPVSLLLANDYRIAANGAILTTGFSLTAVNSGAGNTATLVGDRVFFTPDPAATSETFTYTLSDGTGTATGTVTVSLPSPAPFTLQLVSVGTAVFDGVNTSATYAFIGVPNQLYTLQYTSDLDGPWFTLPATSTGLTGSFAVDLVVPGDHAALWNSRIFFRAVRTP